MSITPSSHENLSELRGVAREALDAFASISDSAKASLSQNGVTLDSFANVNESTAEELAKQLGERNDQRVADCEKLRHEPAIARIVIEDEDEAQEVLYISSSGRVDAASVRLCSYMSPKGRLASFPPGDGTDIALPEGRRWFEVRDKLTFKPIETGEGWDSQPALHFRESGSPLTIGSLRELLREDGYSEEDVDAVSQWLTEGDAEDGDGNISEGIKRDALTAMQLRIAPILDRFQDEIFRLPIDSQIAVLGPPGTGKTTTLVRRLRQKLDFNYLGDDERLLVEGKDAAGLSHQDSWILFTPTELLRLYVKEALGKEGVPVHDERLRTWDDYRWTVARNDLGILRKGTGGGFVMPRVADDSWLAPDTLSDQTTWFEAFNDWQTEDFFQQLTIEAEHLQNAEESRAAALGKRALATIERSSGNVVRLLAELADLRDDLVGFASGLGEGLKTALSDPIQHFAKADPEFLDALSQKVAELLRDAADNAEDEDDDPEEEESGNRRTLNGRRLVADIFRRSMRTLAIGQATGRKPSENSRAGRILSFLTERGLDVPDLKDTGQKLLLQRAAGRCAGGPANYLRRIPQRYRRFRRGMRIEKKWYGETVPGASQAHPAEIDLIMLAMLRGAAAIEGDRLLSARLSERRPPILDDIARLRRNQILVDETTDFSPVQLACMSALAKPEIDSLFLSGDFNQRLTRWGSRSEEELKWVAPGLEVQRISVSYRQSRKLASFARTLARSQGAEVDDKAPEFGDNVGFDPVFGPSLDSDEERARWLTDKIREIERVADGEMPTIAVLVPSKEALGPLTEALNIELASLSLQAKAYSDGEAIGKTNDVRVFPIEHIKGLEFEAVFFVDVDQLAQSEPDLFDRYIYVGATRAATFLGLTCRGSSLPTGLDREDLTFGQSW